MKWLPISLMALMMTGCASLPFEAGHVKGERPYPEGEWIGPVSVDVAKRTVFEAIHEGKRPKGWPAYDPRAAWLKLKKKMQPGDEIWEFRMSPFIVDGGNRYLGCSLVRGKKIIASVVIGVIEEHAP